MKLFCFLLLVLLATATFAACGSDKVDASDQEDGELEFVTDPDVSGPRGDKGVRGTGGQQGTKGRLGDQGPAGNKCVQGDPGGPTGATGLTGATGIQGEQRLKGVQGIHGATGTKGETGTEGIRGYLVVVVLDESHLSKHTVDALRPTGKVVLGGRYSFVGEDEVVETIVVTASVPITDGTGWRIVARDPSGSWRLYSYAVCADEA